MHVKVMKKDKAGKWHHIANWPCMSFKHAVDRATALRLDLIGINNYDTEFIYCFGKRSKCI